METVCGKCWESLQLGMLLMSKIRTNQIKDSAIKQTDERWKEKVTNIINSRIKFYVEKKPQVFVGKGPILKEEEVCRYVAEFQKHFMESLCQ